MDEITKQIVFGIAAPAAIGLVAAIPGAFRKPSVDDRGRPRRDVLAVRLPLALGGAVALAFLMLYGWPEEQWQAVLWVAVGAGAVGAVASMLPRRSWSFPLVALVLGATTLVLLWPVVGREALPWKLVVGIGPVVLYALLEPVARRVPGAALPFALAGAAGAAALVVLLSGFLKLAVPCGALAVALTAVSIAGARWRGLMLADGAMCVVASMLVVAPVVASLYMISASLPITAFVLPAAAPVALLPLILPAARRRVPLVILSLMVVAIAFTGVGLGALGGGEAAEEDPYADMYQDMMGG